MLNLVQEWGRGHPEEYTNAMNLGEERFDSIDSDKKPRAGQILWIRGLTRLQTQLLFYLIFYDLRKKNVKYFHIC
uniref:Plasma membrane calcium transporting P-type ATPase C-terminal domain-containing protein n=1 Tax=Glossina palpalis gambiensis TaxID=67801 RepID=A0A1B0BW64_9MUSC